MSTDRRSFFRQSSALLIAPSLAGLVACSRDAGDAGARPKAPIRRAARGEGGYGALVEAGPELALPVGFTYSVVSRSGPPMSDGVPTPGAFDGMATFALPNGNVRLIRNHENRDLPFTARLKGRPETAYDRKAGASVTSLELHLAADGTITVVKDFISLNGTCINCAGGPTPWGSWLTCEETTEGRQIGWDEEHGYIFEIPASAEGPVEAVPLKAMGRFVHEAVAVDPESGIVYETEDRQVAGFYRFLPTERGVLRAGGRLEMLAIKGQENYDTADGQRVGVELPVTWVEIRNPDPGTLWGEDNNVFAQGFTGGGARFSRLEGCWYGDRSIYFHATNGGDARLGQVWRYRPGSTASDGGTLTLIFESPSKDVLNAPDNVTVSPRGGIVICEDNEAPFVRGLTHDGAIFDLAKNLVNPTEFAGACFSPDGSVLFVNIMGSTVDAGPHQGYTLAIRGPWEAGAL
ncbi:MAG TPA: alkaline phosphatase PhoX [Gemmatimonadaceae bacterium]|nr:alkaline phosphatase PhoX [Gemmatimonadaceae bacterium]